MPRNRTIRASAPTALIAAFFLGASAISCRPAVDPEPLGPEVRLVVRTQPANAHVGAPIETPPVVDVIDRNDAPIATPGLTVRATVEVGNGSISAGSEVNVVNGVATFTGLTFLGAVDANIRLRFTLFADGVPNNEALVTAEPFKLVAGPPTSITAVSAAPEPGTPDALATPAPAVLVRDAGNNPLTGIPVTFAVSAGEGRVSGAAQSTTDATGVATVSGWVLGLPGANQLIASVSPTMQVTFSSAVTTTAGVLRVRLNGHPASTTVRVRVLKTSATGPTYDVFHDVRDSLTVKNLPFGTYQLIGDSAKIGSRIWLADASVGGLAVNATTGPSVAMEYREHGRLEVTARGLPGPLLTATVDFLPISGASAALFAFVATNDAVTRGLGPVGTYDAIPRTVQVAGQQYTATPAHQTVPVPGGDIVARVTVNYTVITGTLTVVLAGNLPQGAAPQIDVTGPGGFRETVFMSGTRSWTGLVPGPYTVVASPIAVGAVTFNPTPATSPAVVAAGDEQIVTITYAQ